MREDKKKCTHAHNYGSRVEEGEEDERIMMIEILDQWLVNNVTYDFHTYEWKSETSIPTNYIDWNDGILIRLSRISVEFESFSVKVSFACHVHYNIL